MSDHMQELFDRVATHLLTQGRQSFHEVFGCRYRLDDLRCAIGCLIDNAHYDSILESKVFGHHLVVEAVEGSLGFLLDKDEKKLLRNLQEIHDHRRPTEWRDNLIDLAQKNELSTSRLQETS